MNTKSAPLPYKGAPRSKTDIIMAQVRREQYLLPSLVGTVVYPVEVLSKELPSGKKGTLQRNWTLGNIYKFTLKRVMP